MTRRLAITATLAALFALPAAVERPAPRVALQFPGVYRELGVYSVRYAVADSMDAHEITGAEYAALVAGHACQATSHVTVRRGTKVVTLVCEE